MLNLISSVVFVGIEFWLLLLQPSFMDTGTVHTISVYIIFFYLYSQGLLIQQLKGQEEDKGMWDLGFSVAVIIIQVVILIFADKIDGWFEVYSWYLLAAIYDLAIINRMIFRMFRMSTGFAKE